MILFSENNQSRIFLIVAIIFIFGALGWTIVFGSRANIKHDFTDQCTLCHTSIPEKGATFKNSSLKTNADKQCVHCHTMDANESHPVGVKPQKPIPLQGYLDSEGKLTCLTCHDVHKEERPFANEQNNAGLLRGHARKRAFCATCHDQTALGADWRHTLVATYAHMTGNLIQNESGVTLDEFSIECLSCHDGVISKTSSVIIRSGDFQHGIGLSHPVGVEYPSMIIKNDFIDRQSLPGNIPLFNNKVGCLSCHNPYAQNKGLLVTEGNQTKLCMSCHKK